jgi:alkylation response protein AidB-like acyl-CoA dehydrogenase
MTIDLLLPDQELTPELRAFAASIRTFAREKVAPHARAIDEERRFRRESVGELAAAGILGGPIDPAFGGAGWSPLELAVAHEEIGAVCGNTRGFLAVHTGLVSQCLQQSGDDAQRQRYLPRLCKGELIGCFALTEEEAGSDVASLRTHAERVEGGWEITGSKVWITNGGIADLAIVFATVDPERGKDGITAFLVDTRSPGLTRAPMPGIELGHRGSDHAQLRFARCRLADDAVLGVPGQGFDIAMRGLAAGRLSVAAGAVGIHRAALAASIAFVKQRVQFGKPIASFQMVQERIADMTVELLASRALVHRCAQRRIAGTDTPADLAAAKLYATEAAARAADCAVMLHGARGYSTEYPVERLLRDVMGLRIYEGTTMIQKSILARAVLR